MNLDLVFHFHSDPTTLYRHRERGSTITRGDVLIYSSEVREEGGVNVITSEPYFADSCLGSVYGFDKSLVCLRPIPLEERVFTYRGLRYRVLPVDEVIKDDDISLDKSSLPAHGELPFARECRIGACVVDADDHNYYLRLVEETPAPTPLREAALGVMEYWLGKYQFSGADPEERAAWDALTAALNPSTSAP